MTILERAARVSREVETNAKATTFAEWTKCLVLARRQSMSPLEVFEARNPRNIYLPQIKAAILPATTSDTTWAAPLSVPRVLGEAFVESLRPLSIVEQLRGSFRQMPFDVKAPRSTVGTSVNWAGEGRPVQATAMAFDAITFGIAKICGICVVTDELIKTSDPNAANLIRADLAAAVSAFTDDAFLNPERAAVAGVSPGAITNGAASIASTGSSVAQVEADIASLFSAITTNRTDLVLLLHTNTALSMCKLRTTNGNPVFAASTLRGGTVLGVPTIVSGNVPMQDSSPQEHFVIALDASEVLFGDNGVELDVSTQAIVQMVDTPTYPVDASAAMQSQPRRHQGDAVRQLAKSSFWRCGLHQQRHVLGGAHAATAGS